MADLLIKLLDKLSELAVPISRGFYSVAWLRRLFLRDAVVELALPSDAGELAQLKWGLLHVRDGLENSDHCGPVQNRVHGFERSSDGRLTVSIPHRRQWVLQFKCFVECDSEDQLAIVDRKLRAMNLDPRRSASGRKRLYVLLPHVPTCETPDKLVNNIQFPE